MVTQHPSADKSLTNEAIGYLGAGFVVGCVSLILAANGADLLASVVSVIASLLAVIGVIYIGVYVQAKMLRQHELWKRSLDSPSEPGQ